ncbi:MAG: hypothetical protein Q4E54_04015 [Lachnospiraceae bacterium]|nr:hypothetical protein [Lachnospiraceae bacterium]
MSKFTDEQWLEIFRQCKASGISDLQWCRENHIAPSTFYYRLKKLRKEASAPAAETKVHLPEYHEVVPLIVCDEEISQKHQISNETPRIRISIGEIKLDVYSEADHALIAETLMAVKSIC